MFVLKLNILDQKGTLKTFVKYLHIYLLTNIIVLKYVLYTNNSIFQMYLLKAKSLTAIIIPKINGFGLCILKFNNTPPTYINLNIERHFAVS